MSDLTSKNLNPDGLYRWRDIKPIVPVSRETWRKQVLAGKAPAAVLISPRCTCYRGIEVLRWLKDPASYQQPPAEG